MPATQKIWFGIHTPQMILEKDIPSLSLSAKTLTLLSLPLDLLLCRGWEWVQGRAVFC